jgi:catechol 2,3-dioxygenase
MAVDEGLQTAFYYADPDDNSVELNVNNYGNNLTATEPLQHSPEFATHREETPRTGHPWTK